MEMVKFMHGDKCLGSYDLKHEFPGERRASIELLAYEHNLAPSEITVKIEDE
jgi:hypothetical protein